MIANTALLLNVRNRAPRSVNTHSYDLLTIRITFCTLGLFMFDVGAADAHAPQYLSYRRIVPSVL